MSDEFSTLSRVKASKGKAQWAQARYVKSETNEAERLTTHITPSARKRPPKLPYVWRSTPNGKFPRLITGRFYNR